MKKIIKLVLYACIGFVATGLLVFIALKFYFTPERIKTYALEFASKNLHREIRLTDASLSLAGIRLTELAVSEYPDFTKGEFLAAKSISVRPSFSALLRKEVKINSLSADGLVLHIIEVKKDAFNFSDLLTPSEKPAAKTEIAKPDTKSAMALDISAISVKNSELSYRNMDNSMAVDLKNIELSASSLSGNNPFPVQVSMDMGIKTASLKSEFATYAKGKASLAGFNFDKAGASIEKGRFGMGAVKCEFTGDLKNYFEPDARLSVTIGKFSSGDLKKIFPAVPSGMSVPEMDIQSDFKLTASNIVFRKLNVKTSFVQSSLTGRIAWDPAFDYTLSAAIKAQIPQINTSDLARTFAVLPKEIKVPPTDITANADLRPGSLKVNSFTVNSGSVKTTGNSDVFYAGNLRASGLIKAEDNSLEKTVAMLPMLKDYGLSGKVKADLKYVYAAKMSFSGNASLEEVGAKLAGRTLSALKGVLTFSNDQITSGPMTGKLDGEDLKTDFTVKNWAEHPRATLNIALARLVIRETLAAQTASTQPGKAQPAEKPFYIDLAGKAQIGKIEHPNFLGNNAIIKYDLRNISEDMKLSGTASFNIDGGKFSNLYEFAQSFKAAKVALFPILVLQKASKLVKGLPLPDFNNINYTKMAGDYLFQDGNLKINKSDINSNVADATATGNINLPSETLDMKIATTLKESIATGAPIVLNVKGTLSSPSVKPDLKSITEQPMIKEGVEKLLKGLFKH